MEYDKYSLFLTIVIDALNYETKAIYDYRVLQPKKIADANDVIQLAKFDTRGMLVAMAVTNAGAEGDTLDDPTIAYKYNLFNWIENAKPVLSHVKTRILYGKELLNNAYICFN